MTSPSERKHGVRIPVITYVEGDKVVFDRGLAANVARVQKDGFVWIWLERGSPEVLTKVHRTRLTRR